MATHATSSTIPVLSNGSSLASATALPVVPPALPTSFILDFGGTVVYYLNIFFVVAILVFALFNTPRAIARFARISELVQGLFLRSAPIVRKPQVDINADPFYQYLELGRCVQDLGGSSTEHSHHAYYTSRTWHDEKGISESRPQRQPPMDPDSVHLVTHMPMASSLALPLANLLHRRVSDQYSLGQVLVMAGYAFAIMYACVHQNNPFSGFPRMGWVAVSQLPLIYILATKNNLIGMLLSTGYEKLNYFHRFAGRIAVFAANLHAIGFLYQWNISGTLSMHIFSPGNLWGFLALICLNSLCFFSTQTIRSKFYNLFLATHAVSLIVVLIAVCYHQVVCIPYVIVVCAFYSLDYVVRVVKTRITTAILFPIPELGLTRVEMPYINSGWRPGQHVRLRVLSTAMGLWGMTETHPFTIATVNKTEEGLVLLCKKSGKWTTKMYELATTSAYSERGCELGRSVRVMVEGPYGGVGNTMVRSYSGALFIIGGSGISFALTMVQDLVRRGNTSNVMDMEIVWCIADATSLAPLITSFTTLISQCTAARLRISVFYTRATSDIPAIKSSPSSPLEGMYLPPGITLSPGRPKLNRHLEGLVSSTRSVGGCSGVFVGACGPLSLARSAAETVRQFDADTKRAIGGVEYHEETFGW